jgi:hypothetical protein
MRPPCKICGEAQAVRPGGLCNGCFGKPVLLNPKEATMQGHPFADEYPLMPAGELKAMIDSMAAHGYDQRFPVVRYEEKLLDGRNRWAAAGIAGVSPSVVDFEGNDDDAREFVRTANEHRRHLTVEWLMRRRAERIERVAAARVEGESLRTIAEAEGVSLGQVQRDLETASTVSGDTVEPANGQVQGRDGRAQTATPSIPDREPGDDSEEIEAEQEAQRGPKRILCEKCTRLGAARDCPQCAAARAAKAKKPKKKAAPRGEVKDQTGAVVPDNCRDAFADPSLGNLIAELEQIEAMFGPEGWVTRAGKLTDHYGFILIDKFHEHAWEAHSRLQLALEALRAGVPYAVCPKCHAVDSKSNGKACKGCRGYGHVPETRFAELSK